MSEKTCLSDGRSCEVILVSPLVSVLKAGFTCKPLTLTVFLLLLAVNKTLLKTWETTEVNTDRGFYHCFWEG